MTDAVDILNARIVELEGKVRELEADRLTAADAHRLLRSAHLDPVVDAALAATLIRIATGVTCWNSHSSQ